MKGCFSSLARTTYEAIQDVKKEVATVDKRVTDFEAKQEESIGPLETDHRALKKEVAELRQLINGRGTASSGGSQSTRPEDFVFVIGSLGRDVTKEVAEARARDILSQVGCRREDLLDLWAPYAFGSQVNLKFRGQTHPMKYRPAIRDLNISFGEGLSNVWMDVKKTKEQLLPNRILKLVMEAVGALQNIEEAKLIKCGSTKHLYYESRQQKIGSVDRTTGNRTWGAYGEQQVDNPTRQAIEHRIAGIQRN